MLQGTKPGRIILDELNQEALYVATEGRWRNTASAKIEELWESLKQPTVAEEVRQLLGRTAHEQRPLPIKRLPITTLKLTREIGKSHGAECTCILCKVKGPKTERFKQVYGG